MILRIWSTDPKQTVQEIKCASSEITIGRSRQNTLCLDGDGISRFHARLNPMEDGLKLEDCGSTNGTWVGENRVDTMVLTAGARFRIGEFQLELLARGTEQDSPQPSTPAGMRKRAALGSERCRLNWRRRDESEFCHFDLVDPVVDLGRDDRNDIVLKDPAISRFHSRIEKTPQGYLLIDRGSMNGTFIGLQRIDRAMLQLGDQFRIGEWYFDLGVSGLWLDLVESLSDSESDGAERMESEAGHALNEGALHRSQDPPPPPKPCMKCGEYMVAEATACPKCGYAAADAGQTMPCCPSCGSRVSESDPFCGYCGRPFGKR